MAHHHPHHQHHHHHHQHVPHGHDYSAANKDYFNQTAHDYDNISGAVEVAQRLAGAMRKAYPFAEDSTTVMDYACGTGLISRELAPHTKSIVGVDISQGMVDQYNTRVENQGIPSEEMRAVCVELKGQEGELDGAKFDVVVCASAYHHFTSIDDVTRILASFLKPGGSLLVADLLKTETSHEVFPEQAEHIVAHLGGLEENDMRKAFEGASLESFSIEHATEYVKQAGRPVSLFLAKGTKPLV